VYRLFAPLIFICLLPGALWRAFRRGGNKGRWRERFGDIGSGDGRSGLEGCIWVRSISVGETLVALRFVLALRRAGWKGPVVLTATTSTGVAVAEDRALQLGVRVFFNPIDFRFAVDRFLGATEPTAICFVEGDFWPNLTESAFRRGVSLHVVNARLSPRSAARYACVREWLSPLFACFSSVQVADEESLERWRIISCGRARGMITGNLKFDSEGMGYMQASQHERDLSVERLSGWGQGPLLVAGSTHDPEEVWIAGLWRSLRVRLPGLRLVLVPRHVERCAEIEVTLNRRGFSVQRSSAMTSVRMDHETVVLVDSTGELRSWYRAATVALIGRSFLARGGQNPAEPLMAGAAAVVGPSMENFTEVTRELVSAGGLLQVACVSAVEEALLGLLLDSARRERMVAAGRSVLARHDGSAARAAGVVLSGS
jgi:3-deoxy-D-manno-octulosonic-acid transferase